MVDQAIVRAKSHLAAATYGARLVPGDTRGDDGGGFRWRLRIVPVESAAVRPLITGRARLVRACDVYGISVLDRLERGRPGTHGAPGYRARRA